MILNELVRQPPESMGMKQRLAQVGRMIESWLGWIIAAWFTGVVLLAMRTALGLWTQSRLRRVGVSPVSTELEQRMRSLSRRMGVSRMVGIAQSTIARIPMVIGYVRPLILLPASVLSGLTPIQLNSSSHTNLRIFPPPPPVGTTGLSTQCNW